MLKNHTQVVLVYIKPYRRNSFLKCVPQPKLTKKFTKIPYFGGSGSFRVIEVDTLILTKSSSPVFVMIRSMYMPVCNRFHAHHCLFGILPAENEHEHEIRKRGHNFVLPHCNSNLFKASFLNRCLFSLI